MPPRHLRLLALALSLVTVAGCGHDPEPVTRPTPRTTESTGGGRATVALRSGWGATVVMQRQDSLVLTLPNGARQVQHVGRMARFTMEIGANNTFTAVLDSLGLQPPSNEAAAEARGTRWSGRITGAGRIEGLRISRASPLGDDLTAAVRSLVPMVPFAGTAIGRSWKDTVSGSVQVEVFRAQEQRVRSWSAGERTDRGGMSVYPIRVREEFEQLGRGSQSGREMTMTAQGSRVGYYYITADGRVDGAVLQDSVAQFITIPSAKQTIPTMRYSRTTLRYSTSARAERP
ncbi:MAG: hypothetical protein ABIZ70_09975 [Gemmatimonadales bacterium]